VRPAAYAQPKPLLWLCSIIPIESAPMLDTFVVAGNNVDISITMEAVAQ
jgi:hypothetical protein